MADQAVATTVVEGDEVGPSDRMLPKALDLMSASATKLYEAGRELKKRPILQKAVEDVAFELSEAADDFGPRALEFGAGRDDIERLAREEIAELAKRHVVRLHDCDLRKRLMNFRHELEFNGPIQNRDEDSEGFTERGRLRSLLAELEWTLAGLGDKHHWRDACEEFAEALRETLALYEDTPREPEPKTEPLLPAVAEAVAHLAAGLSRKEVLLVCTLAVSRDEIEENWDRLDAAGKEGDERAEGKSREEVNNDTISHQHRALMLIAEGKVDPTAAATAALYGSKVGG